jgi:hypothetical protein
LCQAIELVHARGNATVVDVSTAEQCHGRLSESASGGCQCSQSSYCGMTLQVLSITDIPVSLSYGSCHECKFYKCKQNN